MRGVAPPAPARVLLYWIPVGAGGAATVRASGRIYEKVRALIERRAALDLYHTAIEVHLDGGRYIVENAWPSPDDDAGARGVVVEGPVWSPWLARFRVFRYEVRCWRDGIIPDAGEAVARHTLSTDSEVARRILDLAGSVPPFTWGRRVLESEEMWNSNSVISYLLVASGISAAESRPPDDGRAPGWETGIIVANGGRDLHASIPGLAKDDLNERPRGSSVPPT